MSASPLPSSSSRGTRRLAGSRQKRWLGFAALLGVTAVATVISAQFWLESYLQSDAFRRLLQKSLGQILHGTVELEPLHRSGTALSSEALSAQGRPSAAFRSVQLHALRAEIDPGGLWRRVWRLEQLAIQSVEVDLASPVPSTSDTPPADVPSSPSIWRRWLPSRGEIGTLRAEHALLRKGSVEARNLRLTANPTGPDWQVSAENGELSIPSLPPLTLSSAKAVLRPGACILRQAHVLGSAGGQATLSGQWNRSAASSLQIRFENFPSETLLPLWWKSRLKGLFSGQLQLHKGPNESDPFSLTGPIQLHGGRLETLPLLESLNRFLGSPRFQSVALKKASADLDITPSKTVLRKLDLDGDGLFRIQGEITIEAGQLEGQLQLGLSPSLIQWLPGASTALFKEQRDGYRWTPFQISGSCAQPSEDLSNRLLAATKDAAIETLKSVLPNVPTPLPQALDAAKEAAKGALDTLKSVLPPK